MANIRVWDGGSNTSPYDTWAKAATAIQTALTAWSSGDQVWVASDHDEKWSANTTLTIGSATKADQALVISVNRTDDSYQNMEDGGGALDAKTNGVYDIVLDCNAVFVGTHMKAGDNIQFDQDNLDIKFIDSLLEFDDDLIMLTANSDISVEWEDVKLLMANGARIRPNSGGRFVWRGGSLSF